MAVDGLCGCGLAGDSAAAQECGAGEVLALAGGFDEVSGSPLTINRAGRFAPTTAPCCGAYTGGDLFRGGCGGAAVCKFHCSSGISGTQRELAGTGEG